MAWRQWAPYVPVATRRRRARKKMEALRKKGVNIQPVEIEGRKIAKTFWGEAWCNHLESFSDYENRLPRGRTYVRNGSVCHLAISKGLVEARVSGSSLYALHIRIKTLSGKKWNVVKKKCGGQVGSLIELLQGRLSDGTMKVVTDRRNGLFPLPNEISLSCDCPDGAVMCKHVAAALYGVGARLDEMPELLFTLRGVDHEELIDADAEAAISAATSKGTSKRLQTDDLSDMFGIDLAVDDRKAPVKKNVKKKSSKKRTPKTKKTAGAKGPTKKTNKRNVAKKPAEKGSPKKTARKASKKKPAKKTVRKAVKNKAVGKNATTKKKALTKKPTKKTARKKKSAGKASRKK